jgi:membrane fusion protein (multidrug efflux system)
MSNERSADVVRKQANAHEPDDVAARRRADDQSESSDQDQDGGSKKRKKRLSPLAKVILLVLAVVAIVAAIIWFIHYQTRGKFRQSTNDAYIQVDDITIAPRINGYVQQVLVDNNQDVKRGQPLVRIDDRDYRAQAAEAEAQIAQAGASADAARASIREQYATIEQSRAQLAGQQAVAAHDAGEVARYAPLAAAGAETRQQLAQLRSTAIQSAETARAGAAQVVVQQRRIAGYQAQIRQAQAQARQARARLAATDVDVGAAVLRAPLDGRIGDKTVTVGQYAQSGTRLMTVVPLDKLYVTANFKETQVGLMRVGQPATIKVDALSGVELHGRVESVSPGTGAQFSLIPPNNATGNFTKIVQRVPIRIAIRATPDAWRLLVPGLSVTAEVDTIAAKGDMQKIKDQQKQLDRRR